MTILKHKFFLLSLLCLTCLWTVVICQNSLNIIREWVQLEFVYPNEEARVRAVTNKYFVPEVSIPIDVDVYYGYGTQNPRIFITVPRFDVGRPITLGTVGEDGRISGYPDYSWHDYQGKNCEGLTSVFRVAIDNCHRLWVVDTGKIGNQQKCQPQVLAFDLKTDQLIYRHRVPSENFIATTRFITLVVDVRGSGPDDCADTFVYVADVSGFGLLVVDVARDRSWRVTHRYFFPYPSRGLFIIDGESFNIMDGVLGMALSPYVEGSDRLLYFHAFASTTENVVRTSLLRNDSFIEDPNANPNSINVFQAERPSQSGAEAIDDDGVLYFGLVEPPSMWSWNTSTKFSPYNFNEIAVNGELLPFPLGVKVVSNPKGHQELWLLTSNFHRVISGNLTSDRINIRLHAGTIPALLRNTRHY
ncbi:protein yellow-like [Danaus plexippus]|uniref:protein yellow-like n=1 Tax=Danaus plexippus TaxID=13037 RepID=UPI002AB2728F|nr:protein yellow-like [Danaus plexippus]